MNYFISCLLTKWECIFDKMITPSLSNDMQVDLHTNLRRYMPAMFRLLMEDGLSQDKWDNLNRKFVSTYQKRIALQTKSKKPLIVEANLYDLISSTFHNDKSALRFVGYIDIIFKLLGNNLFPEEKLMVTETLYNVLVSHDHQFRNYIGELSVLNKAIEKRTYNLIGVERDSIAQGTTADFTLLNNQTGKTELFEVVNIHLNNSQKIKGRLFRKIKEKTCKQANYTPFTLIPVLWAEWKILKEVEQLYITGNGVEMEGVNEPFAFCAFSDENNKPIYRFMPIKKLFPEGRILVNWIS